MNFLQTFAETAETDGGLFGALGIDWRLLILQIVAFLLLIFSSHRQTAFSQLSFFVLLLLLYVSYLALFSFALLPLLLQHLPSCLHTHFRVLSILIP